MTKFLELLGHLATTPGEIEKVDQEIRGLHLPIRIELANLLTTMGYPLSLYDLADLTYLFNKKKGMLKDIRDEIVSMNNVGNLNGKSKAAIGLGLVDYDAMSRQAAKWNEKVDRAVEPDPTDQATIQTIFARPNIATNMNLIAKDWCHPGLTVCSQCRHSYSVTASQILRLG